MTRKQSERLGRILLEELPGFVLKSPLVFLPPTGHFLYALCFQGSRFSKTSFYLYAFVLPLFVPTQYLNFNLSLRVRQSNGTEGWDLGQTNLVEELRSAMRHQALPFFPNAGAPSDIIKATLPTGQLHGPYDHQAIAYALTLEARIDDALSALERLLLLLDPKVSWQNEMAARANLVRTELKADPCRTQRRLLAWEEETVRNLKLEAFR